LSPETIKAKTTNRTGAASMCPNEKLYRSAAGLIQKTSQETGQETQKPMQKLAQETSDVAAVRRGDEPEMKL
jgi:hypothetical protein